jgi:low temperature requirement protein LtrA
MEVLITMPTQRLKYEDQHRHATWLELFFDLVFVAIAGVITHHLAEVHEGHIEQHSVWLYVSQFVAVWWIWATHTLFANRFDRDDEAHRALSLLIMLLMVAMAAFLHDGLESAKPGVTAFVLLYVAVRLVLATMFWRASRVPDDAPILARHMSYTIFFGAAAAGARLLCEGLLRPVVFFGPSAAELVAFASIGSSQSQGLSVHRRHLVERIGLLSIVLLGESIISLVAGLSGIEWDRYNVLAAITGFVMLASIWWIYFDSFYLLEGAKRLTHGIVLVYSHALFLLGLGVLASLIWHAIRNDLVMSDFRWLAIAGMTLFYVGKQISYFVAIPPYRINKLLNSVVCIGVTVASTYLPRAEWALLGATLGMIFYAYSNFRWTFKKDALPYLDAEAH